MSHNQYKNMSVEAIYKKPRRRFLLFSPILVVSLGFIISDVLNHHFQLTGLSIAVAIIYFLLIFYLYKENVKSEGDIVDILFEEMDVKKYSDYLEYVSQQKGKQNDVSLSQGILSFYKGDFDKAIHLFESHSQLTLNQKLSYDITLLTKHYYYILSTIHSQSKSDVDAEQVIMGLENYELKRSQHQKLKEDLLQNCRDIHKIMTLNQTTSRFAGLRSDRKLIAIMYRFYEAKNQLILQNDDKARALFQQLSTENPELFYVEEARRCLKQMQ